MRLWRRIPLHPFLFAAYPTLTLLSNNIDQMRASSAMRALLVSLLVTGLILVLLRLLLRDWQRAAILTSLLAILFFSYGHLYLAFKQATVFGVLVARHRTLVPLFLFPINIS